MLGKEAAASVVARTRVDNSGLARGMNEADRILLQGTRTMQQSARSAGAGIGSELGSAMLGQFGRYLTLTGAAAGAIKAGRWLVETAIQIDDVSQSAERAYLTFQRLAGSEAPEAMERLREATRRAASDQELMAGATRFLTMRLADNITEAARMAEIATQLGMAMSMPGGPTAAMSDFALLLANQSIQRLDQFGISSGAVRERIDELTSSQTGLTRETAFVTAVMEQAEEAMRRVGEQAPTTGEALAAAMANLRYNAMWAIGQTDIMEAFGLGRGTVTQLIGGVGDMFGRIAQSRTRFDQFEADIYKKYEEGVLSLTEANYALAESHEWLDDIMRGAVGPAELEARIEGLVSAMAGGVPTAAQWELTLSGMETALYDVASAADDAHAALGALLGDPSVQSAKRRYEMSQLDPEGQLAYLKYELQSLEPFSTDYYNNLIEQNRLEERIANDRTRRSTQHIAQIDKETMALQQQMRAAAEAVYRPSMVTDRDWWEVETGTYRDKPDEYLRRLRSAVEDPASDWKHLLEGRTGAAAKLYLADQERAWEMGQWERLGPGFDPEASMSALRSRMIEELEARRAREAMIAQIMSGPEFAALGATSSERARIRADFGLDPGVDLASSIGDGMLRVDVAAEFTRVFVKNMEGQTAEYELLGERIAGHVSVGVRNALPITARAIAKALVPAFYDEMQAQGML
jgi:hypothetical protein